LLAVHLKELSELTLEFDLEATGFETPEIDLRIQSLDLGENLDDADEFEPASGQAVCQPGDLWILDQHRIYCGDALKPESFKVLMGAERASGVFIDPPYNVKIDGHVSGKGDVKHREFAMASGEMDAQQFTQFLESIFGRVKGHVAAGAFIYACMDWRHVEEIAVAGRASKLDLLNMCVWVKTNEGMGSLYRSQHELIFVFRNGPSGHRNNVQLGRFGRNRSNVWTYPGANGFRHSGKKNPLDFHPTVKPIALVSA
jgi:DNA modification methylase